MSLGRLAHYDLLEPLGKGGMGVVFKARDTQLRRNVAIKILRPSLASDSRGHVRLLREACAEAALNHDNIATVFSFEEAPLDDPELAEAFGYKRPGPASVDFMTMEYVEGEDLASRVSRGDMSLSEILNVGSQITEALDSAHETGVIHRDLKTKNIRVTPKGKVKILDFGLAHWQETVTATASQTPTEFVSSTKGPAGTAPYMPPEQARGALVDARSDLFSFGVVLYEMVTGHLPFPGRTIFEVQDAMRESAAKPMSQFVTPVPDALERTVQKCLARTPEDRYQNAREVADALQAIVTGVSPAETLQIKPEADHPFPWKKIALTAATLVTIALLAIGVANIVPPSGPPETHNLAVRSFQYAGDPTYSYVAEGFAPSIITDLSQVERLNVLSLSPNAQQLSATELADKLGVGSVLEGFVQWLEGTVQIVVSLVDTSSGSFLWTHRYQGPLTNLFDIQVSVAKRVAEALAIELTPQLKERLEREPTKSLDAYRLYVQARRGLEHRSDPAGPAEAVAALREALRMDPEFPLALAALSDALQYVYVHSLDSAVLEEAKTSAQRAVSLDPELLDGRLALARVYNKTGQYQLAKTELERALNIKSDSDAAFAELHKTYKGIGDLEEAEQALLQAVRSRPDSWEHWLSLGNLYKELGDYARARDGYENAINLAPEGETWPYENLAAVEMLEGNYSRAKAVYERIPPRYMSATLASLIGYSFYAQNEFDIAETYYLQSTELEPNVSDWQYNLGDLHAIMGDSVQARQAYEKALELVEAELESNPSSQDAQLWRLVCLSKAGGCSVAIQELDVLEKELPTTADNSFWVAVIYASCHNHEAAIEWIDLALQRGLPRESLRQEPAFVPLLEHPSLRAEPSEASGG